MTREEKIQTAIDKGYYYEPITGKIFNKDHKEMVATTTKGYRILHLYKDKKNYMLRQHQLVYYILHKEIVDCIDHIDGDKLNNRPENLRSITNQQNTFNRRAKGYYYVKKRNKWVAMIKLNYKSIHLGYFNTPEEASASYQTAKKIYHKI